VRISVLGSGSSGNSVLVQGGGTCLLVDAGFSGRDLERRLEQVGCPPESLSAIVITHDHSDHTRGMGVFARRHGTPLYLTGPTREACARLLKGGEEVRPYRAGFPFSVGDLSVEPFITIPDAVDPVAVAVVERRSRLRLGIATDLGRPTAQVRHALKDSDFLILEANHDEALLHQGPYPWSVKRRIASSHGHLSNHAAAQFAVELMHPRLTGVLLAHLSSECNDPELAKSVVEPRLREAGFRGFVGVALQDRPTPLLDVEDLRIRTGPDQFSLL
jgi:phosphoribosyl 1,2-cyclic phosphodiesterase